MTGKDLFSKNPVDLSGGMDITGRAMSPDLSGVGKRRAPGIDQTLYRADTLYPSILREDFVTNSGFIPQ